MKQLIEILHKSISKNLPEGWLCVKADEEEFTEKTLVTIIDLDDFTDEEIDQFEEEKGLHVLIDSQTLEDIADFAHNIEKPLTDETLLESFIYYVENDAFLTEKGFKPLPQEDWQRKIDQDFYDQLGSESETEKCKKENCDRGKINASVFCKVHHFEMIKQKPCPFNH